MSGEVITYSYYVFVQPDGKWSVAYRNAAGHEVIADTLSTRRGARSVAARYNAKPGFGLRQEKV